MLWYIFEYNWIQINNPELFHFSGWNDAYASLKEVSGFSWDSLQHTEIDPTDSHGIIDYPSFMKWRLITLSWWVVAKNEIECVKLCNQMSKAFAIPLNPSSRKDWYRKLTFRHPKYPTERYYVYAKPHKLIDFKKTLQLHRMRLFNIELRVENTFIYDDNLTVVNTDSGSLRAQRLPWAVPHIVMPKVKFTANNDSVYDSYMKYKITGTFQSVRISNLTTWRKQHRSWLWLERNDYIEVDSENWTALKNSVDGIYSYMTIDSNWLSLSPWYNEIEVEFGSIVSPTWDVLLPEVELSYRWVYLTLA